MCRYRILVVSVIFEGFVLGCGEGVKRFAVGEEEFPRELVYFVAYEGNPLFAGTGEDTWDRKIRERGFILREGDKYHMWYTGYNDERSDMKYLGYATSPDGFEWTRYEGNRVESEGTGRFSIDVAAGTLDGVWQDSEGVGIANTAKRFSWQ